MNRYRSDCPRVAIGFAAVAITAIILGVTIVAPASLKARTLEHPAATASATAKPAAETLRIEVYGVRPKVISMQPEGASKAKPAQG